MVLAFPAGDRVERGQVAGGRGLLPQGGVVMNAAALAKLEPVGVSRATAERTQVRGSLKKACARF